MRNRARLSFVGLVLVCVVAALGPAVSARADVVPAEPTEVCNPDGRGICLTVQTYENITASDPTQTDGKRYTWVEWTLRNGSGSQLTHPTVSVKFKDFCGESLTECPGASTAAFVLPADPNLCSVSGGVLTCTYANLAAGAPAPKTLVYFKTADKTAARDVRASDITVTATVKERGNDTPCELGDPNCDTFGIVQRNSYEQKPDEAATFGLNGNRFRLPTNDNLSSFSFTAQGSAPFFVKFNKLTASNTTALCFSDVVCFDRPLSVDTSTVLSYGTSKPVLFFSHLVNAPVPAGKVNAIHYYDPVSLTASTNRLRLTAGSTPSFARMDGLLLTATESVPTPFGLAPGQYFIVGFNAGNATTPPSFQLSATKGGAPLPLTAGTANGEPIRIIGDESNERDSSLCVTTVPASTAALPKICTVKSGSKDVDAYLWDSGNGKVIW